MKLTPGSLQFVVCELKIWINTTRQTFNCVTFTDIWLRKHVTTEWDVISFEQILSFRKKRNKIPRTIVFKFYFHSHIHFTNTLTHTDTYTFNMGPFKYYLWLLTFSFRKKKVLFQRTRFGYKRHFALIMFNTFQSIRNLKNRVIQGSGYPCSPGS